MLANVEDWKVLYDVSSGNDVSGRSQVHNPFNGDIVAPNTWFNLGITDGIWGAEWNSQCSIFCFDYAMGEYAGLLRKMSKELGCSFEQTDVPPGGLTIDWVCSGRKNCFSAITFPKPSPVVSPNPTCCELHALVYYATSTNDKDLFSVLLSEKTSTSGHMDICDLVRNDPYGLWEPLVQAWSYDGLGDRVMMSRISKSKKYI